MEQRNKVLRQLRVSDRLKEVSDDLLMIPQ